MTNDGIPILAAAQGDQRAIGAVLETVCATADMGFAVVARVHGDRWTALQVLDKVDFGLAAGDEMALRSAMCADIRETGAPIVIDDIAGSASWHRHPVALLYGFNSYASFPLYLNDGSFFGTLCAMQLERRPLSGEAMMAALQACAREVGHLLSANEAAAG